MTRVSLSIHTLAFADMGRTDVGGEARRAAAMTEPPTRWLNAMELMIDLNLDAGNDNEFD